MGATSNEYACMYGMIIAEKGPKAKCSCKCVCTVCTAMCPPKKVDFGNTSIDWD